MRNRIHANRVRPACPPPASGPTAALPPALPNAGSSGGTQALNSETNRGGGGDVELLCDRREVGKGKSGEHRPEGSGHLAAVTSALDFPTSAAESLSELLNLPPPSGVALLLESSLRTAFKITDQ